MKPDKAQIYHAAARKYIQYGTRYGFFHAEFILAKHLPRGKLIDGKVCDIPLADLPAFLAELKFPPQAEAA